MTSRVRGRRIDRQAGYVPLPISRQQDGVVVHHLQLLLGTKPFDPLFEPVDPPLPRPRSIRPLGELTLSCVRAIPWCDEWPDSGCIELA
jgi:hypothetical protein